MNTAVARTYNVSLNLGYNVICNNSSDNIYLIGLGGRYTPFILRPQCNMGAGQAIIYSNILDGCYSCQLHDKVKNLVIMRFDYHTVGVQLGYGLSKSVSCNSATICQKHDELNVARMLCDNMTRLGSWGLYYEQ